MLTVESRSQADVWLVSNRKEVVGKATWNYKMKGGRK